jgi:ABC-type multidrug transport system fused ATPase/permease subunit
MKNLVLPNFVAVRNFLFSTIYRFFLFSPSLSLILLSAHDVAFVSVFYFLERRKNEEKEAEDTCGRLSNRLADSHAILIRTKKEEVGYGGSG